MIVLLSGVQSVEPSEFSLKGKCRGLRIRAPPSAESARKEVCFPAHLKKLSFLPSEVSLMPLMQNPDQSVICLGFSVGLPVCPSSRICQKLQAPPKKALGSTTE